MVKIDFSVISKSSLLMMLAAGSLVSCKENGRTKPNVLFFLVDDLGYMDVGFNNPSTFYETPNLDRLAAQGMKFTQAYAACPVCSPTRASIMTGKYPARLHTTDYFGAPQPEAIQKDRMQRFIDLPLLPAHYLDTLPLTEVTLAEALQESGYATFFAGKWHLGPEGYWPENQGFDVNMGGIERGGPYGGKRYFSPYGNPRLEDGPEGEHLPDRLASEAIKFIKAHHDQPWLAYVAFYSVHTPLMARKDLEEKYIEKAKNFPEDAWGQEGERKVRLVQNHPVYAGMVEAMDEAVGKVLTYLADNNLEKNTIVFFMSDNGGLSTSEGHPTSNIPLRAGKGWLYEGGIREPMLVSWPGHIRKGEVYKNPVISTDFYPTILEMAGLPLKPEQHLDGISFAPVLKGSDWDQTKTRAIFFHYPHWGNQGGTPGAAIIRQPYKLIEFYGPVLKNDSMIPGSVRTELYNIADDPGERRDLADSLPGILNELGLELHAWQSEVDATFPSVNPQYNK